MEMKLFDAGTHKLAYADEGTGKPVVLVHGFCGSSRYWQELAPLLSPSCRVIVPDLRGHGASGCTGDAFDLREIADDLRALLDHLNVEQAVLLGHSLGGYVTLAFAESFPERLSAFGLVHSTAYPDSEQAREGRARDRELIAERGIAPFIEKLVPNLFAAEHLRTMPDRVSLAKDIGMQTHPQSAMRYLEAMTARPDRRHVLQDARVPVLLLAGDGDRLIPPERVLSVSSEHIRHARIAASGHLGMLETPAEEAQVLLTFIEGTSA